MDKRKKPIQRVIRGLLLTSIGLLTACSQSEAMKVEDTSPSLMETCGYVKRVVVKMREDGFEIVKCGTYFSEFRHIETGVHYFVYSHSGEVAMTPVYQSDGAVKVTKVD